MNSSVVQNESYEFAPTSNSDGEFETTRNSSGSEGLHTADERAPILAFDRSEFSNCFHRQPFLVSHRLQSHPLFELPRILQLARELPEDHIEYNAGQLPISIEQSRTPRNGLSVEETVRRIQDCQSWMVLKWVHHDDEYGALLNQCLDEIRPLTEQIVPGMRHPQAYIFLTSPGSVTPFHIDPEHNFLLQVRGSKTVHLYNGRDPNVLPPQDLERFYGEKIRNLNFREELRDRGWTYELQPGDGLHFPVTFPHYVENGPDVSVSFSITFRTPDLERRRSVYRFNNGLRKAGLSPKNFGQSAWRDALKYQAVRLWSRAAGRVRKMK